MRLWLLRHAAVTLPAGICYGASDVEADAAATREAAEAAAAQLPRGLPVRVSALSRARVLAEHLASVRPDLSPAVVDCRLNEMDFGCWELKHWHEIPRHSVDAWLADFDGHRFGGVESARCVISRVADALEESRGALGDSAQALWITHAGVIKALHHIARHGRARLEGALSWSSTVVACGSVLLLEVA